MSRSGWCPPHGHTAAQHKVCQMRQDDGLLGPCDCAMHGGHRVTAPPPVEPDELPDALEVA